MKDQGSILTRGQELWITLCVGNRDCSFSLLRLLPSVLIELLSQFLRSPDLKLRFSNTIYFDPVFGSNTGYGLGTVNFPFQTVQSEVISSWYQGPDPIAIVRCNASCCDIKPCSKCPRLVCREHGNGTGVFLGNNRGNFFHFNDTECETCLTRFCHEHAVSEMASCDMEYRMGVVNVRLGATEFAPLHLNCKSSCLQVCRRTPGCNVRCCLRQRRNSCYRAHVCGDNPLTYV